MTLLKFKNSLLVFLEMIKVEHTLFALPFAYTGAYLAGNGRLSLLQLLWITLAMISARTAGMCLNRLIDQDLDAVNPRTQNRALPQKLLKKSAVWVVVGISISLLVGAAALLNPLCLRLSPLAVLLLLLYSYLKRFTWLCHLGLGLVLACAPVGGWLAVAGSFSWIPIVLGGAVLFWLAGFDILYACQDYEFDRQIGLFSIPRRFGISSALWISSWFHGIAFFLFALTGILADLSWPYGIGLMLVAGLLVYEHTVVTPNNLSRVNQAFFQANALISVILLIATLTGLRFRP